MDERPIVQQALLRSELRRLRKESGLTQQEAADALQWTLTKIIRIELGEAPSSAAELDHLLNIYGVTELECGWLSWIYRDLSKEQSARAMLMLARLAAAIYALISAFLIATLMGHRHGHEPADGELSLTANYRPLAGVAAAR